MSLTFITVYPKEVCKAPCLLLLPKLSAGQVMHTTVIRKETQNQPKQTLILNFQLAETHFSSKDLGIFTKFFSTSLCGKIQTSWSPWWPRHIPLWRCFRGGVVIKILQRVGCALWSTTTSLKLLRWPRGSSSAFY